MFFKDYLIMDKEFIHKLRCFRHYFWYIPQIIYINFHYLPFKQAIKLPIWVKFRNSVKRKYHTGSIKIVTDVISFGMIELGVMQYDEEREGMFFSNKGEIEFLGKAHFSNGNVLKVYDMGKLILGDNVGISTSKIMCTKKITIGKETFLGVGTTVMDSDFHPIIDIEGQCYVNTSIPIKIGDYNWLGGHSLVLKGTKTPNHCIVSTRSVLNKIYRIPECSIIGNAQGKEHIVTGYIRDRLNSDNIVKASNIDDFDNYINVLLNK